eukprot:9045402-Karenia_brevis.AAC.1
MGGPGNWYTRGVAHHLCDDRAFPISITSLPVSCRAAMHRTCIKTLPGWKRSHDELAGFHCRDESHIWLPDDAWVCQTATCQFAKCAEDPAFREILTVVSDIEVSADAHQSVQAAIYRRLFEECKLGGAREAFRVRFRRWYHHNDVG